MKMFFNMFASLSVCQGLCMDFDVKKKQKKQKIRCMKWTVSMIYNQTKEDLLAVVLVHTFMNFIQARNGNQPA